jgi:ribokinase
VVTTEGIRGGVADGRRYEAATPPAPIVDTYGAGDSFAAALTFALGRGDELDDALALAARAGAAVITGKGPYSAQLDTRVG